MAKKRSFSDVFAKYKTYDDSEGRGNLNEWRSAFREKMNVEEAKSFVKNDDPLTIMGFACMPTMTELKSVYRKLMSKHHPDFGGDVKTAQRIIAAYTLLLERIS